MKILNLYAGLGGNRKLWDDCEVTAVELNTEVAAVYAKHYPADNVIIADAHDYLLHNHGDFDLIWSSPPCQTHSRYHVINNSKYDKSTYTDMALYQEILFLKHQTTALWIVENVEPYYPPLIPALKVGRHLIWSNFHIAKFPDIRIKDMFKSDSGGPQLTVDELKEYFGIEYDGNIYIDGTHDPLKPLRNCVEPQIGEFILDAARLSRADLFTPIC